MPDIVEYASLRRRLSSLLYESLLLLGVLAALFIAPMIAIGMIFGLTVPGGVMWAYLFIVLGAYFIWLWRRNGQTLAMQTWKLQLIDVDTRKTPTLGRCVLRYLLAWPSMLLTLSGVGLIWSAFADRDRQFIHDRLAGTAIVFNPGARQEVS